MRIGRHFLRGASLPALLTVLLLGIFSGCAGTRVPFLHVATPIPTPAPTPTPVPVGVWTPYEPAVASPDVIPGYYREITLPGLEASRLYAFTDSSGQVRYRLYAYREEVTQGVVTQREAGFLEALVSLGKDGGTYLLTLDTQTGFLSERQETPGVCEPLEVDAEVYAVRRLYTAREETGHYTYIGNSGETCHLVYGSFGEGEPAFYPADESGLMKMGALPFDGDVLVPAYTPMDTPAKDGLYKLVVYQGTQSVMAYLSSGGEWTPYRVMACSTGKITPNGNYTLGERYLYRSLFGGKGQYAVRITGFFLFHSVPIDPAARTVEEGRGRMYLDQYEGLGTRISMGCVRMTVADSKWVFDNCPAGTAVCITAKNGPPCPQLPALTDAFPYKTGENIGWDPTDPSLKNPYYWIGKGVRRNPRQSIRDR